MRIVSGLFLCVVLVVFTTAGSADAAQSGTVTITGAVPAACDITVTPEAGSSNIADISAGDTDRLIATVTESCNDPDGYEVTVAGTQSGDHTGLFLDPDTGGSHPFTISYDGVAVSGALVTDSVTPQINVDKPVRISYGVDAALPASNGFNYAETLTFTVAAK